MRIVLTLAVCLTALSASAAEVAEQALSLDTRPGVTLDFYLAEPAEPARAAAILFSGGLGRVGVALDQPVPVPGPTGNFLVRARRMLASRGLVVATMDAPSDQEEGMEAEFRRSAEHAEDVGALSGWLKRRTGLPVWVVGTSMGSISAANAAERLGGPVDGPMGRLVDGLVLTSSVTRGGHRGVAAAGVMTMALSQVAVPALVVAQRADGCVFAPSFDAPLLLDRLSHSPRRRLAVVEGGGAERSGPCEGLAHHGYVGQEDEVADLIARFILGEGE
jgi:alpha-beta hydrolase superfamily lysophospholipase